MKKLVALLLALMLAIGCVSSFAADDNSEFVTLNWYTKGTKPTDYDLVMEQVNAYLKEKINAEVNINFIGWGEEWDTFVSTSVASNEGAVDIMFTADWDNMNTHISNGYLIPLNGDADYGNLLDDYGAVIKDSIAPGFLSGNQRNGVLYGIACNKEIAADYGFLFDTDMVEKYQLADSLKEVEKVALSEGVVAGLNALTPIMQTVYDGEKDNDKLIAIFGCDQTGLEGFLAEFIYLAGDTYSFAAQTYDNNDPTVINPYATDLMKDIIKITKEWYDKGFIAKDADQHADFGAEFQTGNYFAVTQSMKPGKGAEFTVNGKASMEVRFTHPVIRTKDVGGSMLAIVEGSQHPERAMQFIALLESDSYLLNTIIFGLEGVHFNFVNEAKNRIEQTEVGKNNYNRKGDAWMFGNQLLNYTTTEEAEDKWEQFAAFNTSGIEVQALGFNYDPTKMSAVLTNVNEVKKQYNLLTCGIMTGDVEENLAKMNADMEAAGLLDVLKDVQEQFDAWKSGK